MSNTQVGLDALAGGYWLPIKDGDPRGRVLFGRHYSARPGVLRPFAFGNAAKFTGPGEHMLLLTGDCLALWLWRIERFRRDGQEGINCAIFRNESPTRSSDLIREASALAWQRWPGARLFTFVDPRKIRSTNPGACFLRAGWRRLPERTKKGLVILERRVDAADLAGQEVGA